MTACGLRGLLWFTVRAVRRWTVSLGAGRPRYPDRGEASKEGNVGRRVVARLCGAVSPHFPYLWAFCFLRQILSSQAFPPHCRATAFADNTTYTDVGGKTLVPYKSLRQPSWNDTPTELRVAFSLTGSAYTLKPGWTHGAE